MLQMKTPEMECWDEKKQEFVIIKEQTLQLEHSLLSIRKWEAKWHKPFLSNTELTQAEFCDYLRCMTIGKALPTYVYANLPAPYLEEIKKYMLNPMTATTINRKNKPHHQAETVTAEIVYYWMVTLGIPFECEKWHINQLLMLIEVCDEKGSPGTKMTAKEIYQQNKMLNQARRAKFGTKG